MPLNTFCNIHRWYKNWRLFDILCRSFGGVSMKPSANGESGFIAADNFRNLMKGFWRDLKTNHSVESGNERFYYRFWTSVFISIKKIKMPSIIHIPFWNEIHNVSYTSSCNKIMRSGYSILEDYKGYEETR